MLQGHQCAVHSVSVVSGADRKAGKCLMLQEDLIVECVPDVEGQHL